MPAIDAVDGTRLAYHELGEGSPLICVPGGPMQASAYLGDLGGLSAHRRLVLLDLRGTGESATPSDPGSYRCDRQVDDVEALRAHLGLDRIDLVGHSAGGSLAVQYAARFPERINRLVLVNPSPRAVGVDIADADRGELADLRRDEPWYPTTKAALERIWSGDAAGADWSAIAPLSYRRWDDASQANEARSERDTNQEAAMAYYADGAVDPPATRSGLRSLEAAVLLIAGEYDVGLPPKRATEYAGLFPHAELAVLPRGGHYPWIDDPEWLVETMSAFLTVT
ncbi:MAG TPA: alpha/beta hydrolase [Nocardioidaceae bacterium]|nr:alpha/beta hydrolase [Nocardioidaceae bacterium]